VALRFQFARDDVLHPHGFPEVLSPEDHAVAILDVIKGTEFRFPVLIVESFVRGWSAKPKNLLSSVLPRTGRGFTEFDSIPRGVSNPAAQKKSL
jgi:hypothetical protein